MTSYALTLVAGAPCSGKSTYVREHAQRGDLIVDSDAIYSALSGLELHDRPEQLRPFVWAAFWAVLREVRNHRRVGEGVPTWVIQTAADAHRRSEYRRMNQAHIVVLETSPDVCAQRARARFAGDLVALRSALDGINLWWGDYEPDDRDEVIRLDEEIA